jgi:hypothetical protein
MCQNNIQFKDNRNPKRPRLVGVSHKIEINMHDTIRLISDEEEFHVRA